MPVDDPEPANRPPRRLLITALLVLLVATVGSAGVLGYLGFFAAPKVEMHAAPGYRIAYLSHTGPYKKIEPVLDQVARHLRDAGLRPGVPCALYYDDPAVTPPEQLRSKIGYLVGLGDAVPDSLQLEIIPSREVLRTTFEGSPLIGSYKAYTAIREFLRHSPHEVALPALEIYHADGVIEYQLPLGE